MAYTDRIIEFIREIGLRVHERSLPSSTFLPGVAIEGGELIIDRARLEHPGDVLHEAGHVAIMAPSERIAMNGDLNSDGGEEMAAIAWSYAAVLHLGIDPSHLFHSDGYKGDAETLLANFSNGRYFGVPLLEWFGMTSHQVNSEGAVYPKMRNWVRCTENPADGN